MIKNFWESMSVKSLWNEAPKSRNMHSIYTHVVTVRRYYVLPCFVRLENSFIHVQQNSSELCKG